MVAAFVRQIRAAVHAFFDVNIPLAWLSGGCDTDSTAPGCASHERLYVGRNAAEPWDLSHGQRKEAIGGLINPIRSAEVGMAVIYRAALRTLTAIVEVRGDHFKLQVENGFHEAHFHSAALPRNAASNQTC